jgi:tripartite ATP-independent transporter DctM subunit
MSLLILMGSFFLLLIFGIPVAFALGISSLITVIFEQLPPLIVFQRLSSGMSIFSLMAIPFFIYAGELMTHGGIANKLVTLASKAIGHVRGGLGVVNVGTSMLFGGISGSAVADVSALGSTLIPVMKKKGYDDDYSVNVTVTSATIGLTIPPSHNMIIYSIAAGGTVSVSSLFLAGFIPGILTGVLLMITAYVIAVKRGYKSEKFEGFLPLFYAFIGAIPGLMTAVIILGGVLSGIFTATESGAIAVIYSILVSIFFYKTLSWESFKLATKNAVKTTAMVLFIIASASSFAWLLALNDVPSQLFDMMQTISSNPLVILLLINLILLLLGTFMDMSPLIIITTPIFLPVVVELGMDPVQFGIMLMLNLGIGLVTPPVGSVLFVGCAVAKIPIEQTLKTIWPFYLALLAALMAVTYIPAVSMTLPKLFG